MLRGLFMGVLLGALATLAMAQVGATADAIQWSTLLQGQDAKLKAPQTRILGSLGDWELYWKNLTGNAPNSAPRGVDWNTEQLVAIVLGERATGGYQVFVESIRLSRGQVVVSYVEVKPASGRPLTQAKTSPYVVIRMRRAGIGTPVFAKRTIEGTPGYQPGHRPSYWNPYWGGGYDYPRPLPFRILMAGEDSPVLQQTTRSLNTPADLERYWVQMLGPERARQVPMPEVDWGVEFVAVVHAGSQVGRGYSITIESLQMVDSGSTVLRWSLIRPDFGQTQMGTSSPYAIVRIPRGTGTLRFQRAPSRTASGSL